MMHVFVWERVEQATNSYHSAGGVVVFAPTLEVARQLALRQGCLIREDELPDRVEVLTMHAGPEGVYIMPDAGCC